MEYKGLQLSDFQIEAIEGINRNENVMGILITGSDFGDCDESRQLGEFRKYIVDLEHLVWGGKKL